MVVRKESLISLLSDTAKLWCYTLQKTDLVIGVI